MSTFLLITRPPDLAEFVEADELERSGAHLLLTRWASVLDLPRLIIERRVPAVSVVAAVEV
jgi:hypothetical protein